MAKDPLSAPADLFETSIDDYLTPRRAHLHALAEARFPGPDATDDVLTAVAVEICRDFPRLTPPTVDADLRACVTVTPFDAGGLPRGVPGAGLGEPRTRLRVDVLVGGDASLMRLRPEGGQPAHGWPRGWVGEGSVAIVIGPPERSDAIDQLHAAVRAGAASVARLLALFDQPYGTVRDHLGALREAARNRRGAEAAAARKFAVAVAGLDS